MLAVALTTVVTYLGQKVPRALAIRDGEGVPVPPERELRLTALGRELENPHGFLPYSTVAPAEGAGPSTAFARVLIHPVELTRAWAIDMVQGVLSQTYVELITEWPDGTAVSTATHTNPPIFEPLPRVRANWLPGAEVAAAVASHRALCEEIGGPVLDPRGLDAIAVAQLQNVEVLEHQAEVGMLRPRGEDFGFTLRGAHQSVKRIAQAQKTAA